MSKISATIIADSISSITEDRITSFVIVIPRIVLAEFNTHRMISRNSASSRAIPFETMLKKVQEEPFIPIAWQKDHKGMQGTEYITDPFEIEAVKKLWLEMRDRVVSGARDLSEVNITKQLCNRPLEAFLYHTIICTATEWENFMALRHNPAAEIHIAKVAELMLEAMNESTPKELEPGQWHIPFGDQMDVARLHSMLTDNPLEEVKSWRVEELQIKIATARCARVSYLNYEGGDDYEKDIKLHDSLSSMGHWSPFEHCARAMTFEECGWTPDGEVTPWSGNFKGFVQYRKMFEGENKSDDRLIKK